jgi:carbonic anhydrase
MSHYDHSTDGMKADDALAELVAGNERFMSRNQSFPHQELAYRRTLINRQNPFAAILGCSDSRVPAEMIFDQGFGDLFVVRVAGNVVDEVVCASVEFAVCVLKVSLIMVVGHSSCGAVSATLDNQTLPGYMPELSRRIAPAVEQAKQQNGDLLKNAVCLNAVMMAKQLSEGSDILRAELEAEALKIQPAYYDLETGLVTLLTSV